MGEIVEKIYCCDRDNNDNALAAAILAGNNRRDDWGPMAAMMNGGMNGWMNNPFAYLMFLALFRNSGFGFGDGHGAGTATQGIKTQAQPNAIRTQLQDNLNADCIKSAIQGNGFALSQLAQALNIDFNTLQKCCCDVQAAIQQVAGQVGFSAERVINAINLGNTGIITAVKDCCCCQTQKELIQMAGYIKLQNCQMMGELRNGQRDLGQAITQGFSQTAFQAQQDKCDIIRAGQDNTQRIIDTLNNHWKDEQALKIQDLKFELSQERQNNLINERFNRLGNCGCGWNNNCGCGNGRGC